jgi:hypothetical protein
MITDNLNTSQLLSSSKYYSARVGFPNSGLQKPEATTKSNAANLLLFAWGNSIYFQDKQIGLLRQLIALC